MKDQLKILKSKLVRFEDTLSKRHELSKSFKENVDVIQHTVQTQRQKLIADIDSIVDSIMGEVPSLVEEEVKYHNQECQSNEKNIKEIKQLINVVEENRETMSSTSLVKLTGRLKTTIPLYDVTEKSVIPRLPHFVPGKLNHYQLKSMIGCIQVGQSEKEDIIYEKKEVNSKQVSQISTFRIPQKNQINSICPFDDTHVWMSAVKSNKLLKVNKECTVKESVNLDFEPLCLTLTNTEELLISCISGSPLINKLSKDRRVTRFTDISPLKAWGISVSDSDEVFVTTGTSTIQVLNMSGEKIRQISCGGDGQSIVSLTTGSIAVTTGDEDYIFEEMIVIDNTDQIIHKWSGELDNGQKLEETSQYNIARDRYDRVFVPDYHANQVYVISGIERKAKCFLDKKHGVKCPVSVCVDRRGHVWIGCRDGTVYVMEL